MSTQHPDNVAVPFFAPHPVMTAEDEIREAYYAYSHLGCDEQMWDFEGKEVDEFVVEKLLTTYDGFFRERPLGEDVYLTLRVPNPALERAQAKVLLEVLHSLPRHADVARLFYGRERPPVFELIFPMTTSAAELDRILTYYQRFVTGIADVVLAEGDAPLGEWFGEFGPRDIRIIPLVEDRPYLIAADAIVAKFLRGKEVPFQRVFIARSDPALNYGMVSAVLLSLVALARLDALERASGIPIYPIVGAGGAPFRGNLRPDRIDRCLATYPSVQTFTIQSAFKYDHAVESVVAAIARLRSIARGEPLAVDDERRLLELVDRYADRYRQEVAELAPLVNAIAPHVPRRRMRKLHVGLFGYGRSNGGVSLPRAIGFCASLYSAGLPPEVLGLAALHEADWRWLDERVPSLRADIADACAYLDPDARRYVPPLVAESIDTALARHAPAVEPAHLELTRGIARRVVEGSGDGVGDLVLRAGAVRRFLG